MATYRINSPNWSKAYKQRAKEELERLIAHKKVLENKITEGILLDGRDGNKDKGS